MRPQSKRGSKREGGFMLLGAAVLMLLGVGATVHHAQRLAAADRGWEAWRTQRALRDAEAALLGYAASYADQHATVRRDGPGPGYMPCPDMDGDGSPDPACRRGALGHLPWRRLGLSRYRDGSGETLWYAPADEFRSNPHKHVPLNNETRTALRFDGRAELAALVLAPGEPLEGQDRGGGGPAGYLEGVNASSSAGYLRSGSDSSAAKPGNDRVASVSVGRVMAAVEQRALTEAALALARFRAAGWNPRRIYPWLRAHDENRLHRASPGTAWGRIAAHDGPFATEIGFRWADAQRHLVEASGDFDEAPGPRRWDVPEQSGVCLWTGAFALDCVGRGELVERRGGAGPAIEWTVSLRVVLSSIDGLEVKPPGAGTLRARSLHLTATRLPEGGAVEMLIQARRGAMRGEWLYRAAAGSVVTLRVERIRFALATGAELPWWFVEHEWTRLVHLALSPDLMPDLAPDRAPDLAPDRAPRRTSEPTSGHTTGLTPRALGAADGLSGRGACERCLRWTVRRGGRSRQLRVPGVAIAAGASLLLDRNAPRQAWSDYLEGANARRNGGDIESRPRGRFFNDRVRALW